MDNIGYLVTDCARRMRRLFDEHMRDTGVTGPQARLLLMVNHHEGEQQSFYAARLDVEPITLCRMVDRLEEAGLFQRRADPADRRARRVFCTAEGKRLTAGVAQQVEGFLGEILRGMDDAEREKLRDMLTRMSGRLEKLEGSKGAKYG